MRIIAFLILMFLPCVSHAVCNWEYITKDRESMKVVHKYNYNRQLSILIGDVNFSQALRNTPKDHLVAVMEDEFHVYYQNMYIWVVRENSPIARAFGAVYTVLIFMSSRNGISDDVADLLTNCNFQDFLKVVICAPLEMQEL